MNCLIRKSPQQVQIWRKYIRSCATIVSSIPKKREKLKYDALLHQRQQQATRSIVVQVHSEKSFPELYNYCASFGQIIGAHHYCVQNEDTLHYILLEFDSVQEAKAAISDAMYNDELSGVPVRSPFLWFKAAQTSKRALKSAANSTTAALNVFEGTATPTAQELSTLLHLAENIDEQIQLLHQRTQLNDLGVRLRFLAALQVEQSVSGMFPAANAQPFGSSVNGFGKMGCDLDLILRFDRETTGLEATQRRSDSRLVFHTKENLTNGRSQTQRQMESIGDMLQLFLPGVCHVRRILQARVPIIKYHHEHLNLEVDLSMSNLTGFYMSELLYMFGEFDERVRPLTFCIRRWAQACGLTNPSPGRWITNFSLTCLVMFFLQQMKQPLLPAINVLAKSAIDEDIRVTEDGINCTFGRDFERIGFKSQNTSKISELLLQFFEFYSQFDFNNRAISLNEGRAIAKPDHSALYIVNPLEQVLNVSKNVSLEECERLRIEVRNAAWMLESEVGNATLPDNEKLESPWGLLHLFKSSEKSIIRPNMFFKPRMMEVSDLFDKSLNDEATAQKNSPPTVEFKNANTKKEVESIKTKARQDLKQMRINAAAASSNAEPRATATKVAKSRRGR